MSKTYESVVTELEANIPRDVISSRDGGGGRKLSYLEGWYVIDRLNLVVGHGNWAYSSEASMVSTGSVEGKYGPVFSTHYLAKVTLVVQLPGKETMYFSDYGYGDGTDKANLGKTHELAVKEAVTDGIKRCAKNLGMSMGLALYDKTQENVSDGIEEETSKLANDRPVSSGPTSKAPAQPPKANPPLEAGKPVVESREALEEAIRSYVNVAKAQRKLTTEDFKKYLKSEYLVEKLADLNITQMQDTLLYLTDLTK